MSRSSQAGPPAHDPDADNPLLPPLGPLLSRPQVLKKLMQLPPEPGDVSDMPAMVRLHALQEVKNLHVPSLEELRLYETIDLMIRSSYRQRDPRAAGTWRTIGGEPVSGESCSPTTASAAVVVGVSGTGKTQAIRRCLRCYPQQVVRHLTFPRCVGPFSQLTYLGIDVPASGRLVDLAVSLMRPMQDAMGDHRFDDALARRSMQGTRVFDEWRQAAIAAFLGVLHLDELQNFFKLPPLDRRKRTLTAAGLPELRIADDQVLRSILTLTNTWQIPVLMSGTHDGVSALMRRLSNAGRCAVSGYHLFTPFASASDPAFFQQFLPRLSRYQYVRTPLPPSPELAGLIFDLTAGIQRFIVSLWIHAHRVAFERRQHDELTFDDFRHAAATYMAPVMPAVEALRRRDATGLARYEDLLPRDDGFWAPLWGTATG
jgi:hypothetical protein